MHYSFLVLLLIRAVRFWTDSAVVKFENRYWIWRWG